MLVANEADVEALESGTTEAAGVAPEGMGSVAASVVE